MTSKASKPSSVITLRIPTRVSEKRQGTTIKVGRKKLGHLSPRPKVFGGKLIAGKYILVLRDATKFPNTVEKRRFYTGTDGRKYMEVRHGEEYVVYRLEEGRVVYSDGPPHPDHLQLAVCTARSPGVAEPEDPPEG